MDLMDVASIYQRYLNAEIDREIAPEDQMYASGPSWYFGVGESGLMCILRALVAAELGSVGSLLDLPSGHGRVTRHIRAALPKARLAVCDLDESGVAFCARQWNCEPIFSEPDLSSVKLRGPYDVIWVGSLFTHVDEPRTRAWLGHLVNALGDGGVLVCTWHGRWSLVVQESYWPMIDEPSWQCIVSGYRQTGYGFAPYKNSDSYGVSLSDPAWVVDAVGAIEGVRLLAYAERGWADNHDVLVVGKTDRAKPWPNALDPS